MPRDVNPEAVRSWVQSSVRAQLMAGDRQWRAALQAGMMSVTRGWHPDEIRQFARIMHDEIQTLRWQLDRNGERALRRSLGLPVWQLEPIHILSAVLSLAILGSMVMIALTL